MLPFFAATRPAAARAMLTYRVSRLGAAQAAAREAGLRGAWFPWESAADGRDVTPTWVPGPTAQPLRVWTGERELHVVADIAWAPPDYVDWSGDRGLRQRGRPAPAHRDGTILGLTSGARRRMDGPTCAASSAPTSTTSSWTTTPTRTSWRAGTCVPPLPRSRPAGQVSRPAGSGIRAGGVPRQHRSADRGSSERPDAPRWPTGWPSPTASSTATTRAPPLRAVRGLPRPRAHPHRRARRRGRPGPTCCWAASAWRRRRSSSRPTCCSSTTSFPTRWRAARCEANLDYYEPRTAHGSSLSPATHAGLLARAGQLEGALEALRMAAFLDLDDRNGTASEGLHVQTMGGSGRRWSWASAASDRAGDALLVDPRLPPGWGRLEVPVAFRGRRVRVTVATGLARAAQQRTRPRRRCPGCSR